tara:strand:- start:2799 stop:3815 length:1017 start_codon:yes stop_codon:yes gene_type:complete
MINIDDKIKAKIEEHFNLSNSKYLILKTANIFNLNNLDNKSKIFINLELVNNIRRINKFHEKVNSRLKNNSFYVVCSETLEERRKRVWLKAPLGFRNIVRIIDFIYKRVFPKLPLIKKIYFTLTQGHNRVLSKAEIMGRLISCGFQIESYFEHENLFYVISKKTKSPDFNLSPSYSPIFKMQRIGYKGTSIGVYKLRTMYPYSEYLQDFIIKENKLEPGGKISNDYRVTSWGKFCRKFWLDELPMLINLFKCQLNIIGVRPLSKSYFNKYPQDLQLLRIKIKPGLIPPYYSDMPKNFKEILNSEKKYIESKLKNPIYTDIRYFCKAFINIVFKGARSK